MASGERPGSAGGSGQRGRSLGGAKSIAGRRVSGFVRGL